MTILSAHLAWLIPVHDVDEGEHGRLYVPRYMLPSELILTASRRDKQHLVNLLALGGLYSARDEVREALTPVPDRRRHILDLGQQKSINPT